MSDSTWPTSGGEGSAAAGASLNPGLPRRVVRGSPAPTHHVPHHVRVGPPRSMRAISADVEELLDGLDEDSRQRAALLAGELLAQVNGREPGSDGEPIGLTIELREDAVRLEAFGSVAPSVRATADQDTVSGDPLADWGRFILDRQADRWGVRCERATIWAELEVAA